MGGRGGRERTPPTNQSRASRLGAEPPPRGRFWSGKRRGDTQGAWSTGKGAWLGLSPRVAWLELVTAGDTQQPPMALVCHLQGNKLL